MSKGCVLKLPHVKLISFVRRLFPALLIVATATFVTAFVSANKHARTESVPMPYFYNDLGLIIHSEPAPEAPTVISPNDFFTTSESTVLFLWNQSGDEITYEITYAWDNGFSNAQSTTTIDTAIYISFPVAKSTPLFWKIRSIAKSGQVSEWSPVHSFSFVMQPALYQHGCNGNCSQCTHPCGRRPHPTNY